MSNKTINQALKDLYTGLGGDPQALADNSTCSDYIEDLESAIKGAASGAQIDDTTPSETKVYSSAKTEALIEAIPSLPSVAVGDIGKVMTVESDGEGGATWSATTPDTIYIEAVGAGTSNVQLSITTAEIGALIAADKNVIIKWSASDSGNLFKLMRCIGYISDNIIQFGCIDVANAAGTVLKYEYLSINTNSGDSLCGYHDKVITTQ